jgi:hypothetical protein
MLNFFKKQEQLKYDVNVDNIEQIIKKTANNKSEPVI